MKKLIVLVFASAVALHAAAAAARLARVFGDNMVLQRGKPVPVWGWADKGAKIEVRFAGQCATAVADASGKWRAVLDPLEANKTGAVMEISENGKSVLKVNNILVGEVWVLSGQSNMQWRLSKTDDYPLVQKRANYPLMRYMHNNEGALSVEPAEDSPDGSRWVVTTTNSISGYSATGFYFGERIMLDLDVPVGLVMTAWGGTSMAGWTPKQHLLSCDYQRKAYEKYEEESRRWIATNGYAAARANLERAIVKYAEDVAKARVGKGTRPKYTPAHPLPFTPRPTNKVPCLHWNSKIAPIAGMACAGVLWYQGETESWAMSEGDPAWHFGEMLETLITAWRDAWKDDSLPFVMAQLPSMGRKHPQNCGWPVVRCRQMQVADKMKMVAAAPTLDTGWEHDVHPHDKTLVGERLALEARRVVYGDKRVSPPPRLRTAKFTDAGAEVEVVCAGKLAGRGEPRGFELKFGKEWKKAAAKIRKDGTVFVSSPEGMGKPSAVRYLWSSWDKPDVWLYDAAGVPVSSFSYPFSVR